MAIVFTCPRCGQQTSVDDRFAGSRGVCASCRTPVNIPAVSETGAPLGPPSDYVPQRKKTPSWIIVLAVVGGLSLVMLPCCAGMLLPAIQAAREAARKAQCSNNLKQIDLAMLNYESANRRFPPAGKTAGDGGPAMSWRVAILPYLEQQSLLAQYDPKQPWDSPHNEALLHRMPKLFRCPSDPSGNDDSETSYVMVVGPHTVGGVPGGKGVGLADIKDGASNTLLVVEVRGMKIKWTEPRDIALEELIAYVKSDKTAHVRGFNVAMCDGSVRLLPVTIDAEMLRRMAVIDDGQPVLMKDE